FNPPDPANPQNRIPISVEDVMAYFDLAKNKFGIKSDEDLSRVFTKFIEANPQIHPLALGKSELTVKEHKELKGLQQQNLRDHMSDAELIFTALAELSTREIAEAEKAEGYVPNEGAARAGGKISGSARKALEEKTGKKVVNGRNYLDVKEKSKQIADTHEK
ncbi:MAG: hypothetical protein ABR884_04390, partial [Minisyncoccia bacterium]